MKTIKRLSCLVLGLGMLASATLMARESVIESRVIVKGLKAKAEILIDRWGVPHIYAATQHDAFFVQGWNAARDRLWQMDLWRRSGLGELAAVFGPTYVAQDRAIRLFVYRGDLDQEWAAYGADARTHTQAFVAGLNAYVEAIRRKELPLPVEFKLAHYAPALWTAEDVVRVRNHGLAVSVSFQVLRAKMACQGNLAAAELLFKVSPPWTPIIPEGLDLCTIPSNVLDTYQLAQQPVVFGPTERSVAASAPNLEKWSDVAVQARTQGSNNWVIAPSKTTTGRPILANDPHRGLTVPAPRYIAQLVAPGLNVIGAGEPALPGIAIGHNETIGFGLTVFPIAQEDLYVYETRPEHPDEYRYKDGWEPMRVVHERIAVRGGPNVSAELKFTRHGPVIAEDPEHHRAYAVRATWLDTGGAPYFASMRYLQAKNVQEFASALKYWGEPSENQIYADTRGTIGWFPVGFTPLRPNSDGLLPLPGDGRYEWTGYLDRDLLPSEINPPRGYVATANQMNLPADYPYTERRVGFSWLDDFRFKRISDVLDKTPKISVQNSAALQNDTLSLPARRLIDVLGTIENLDPSLQATVRWLQAWDGRVSVDSAQAALYEVWCAHRLVPAVVDRVAPALTQEARALFGVTGVSDAVVTLMEHPDSRLGTDPQQARDELMRRTLTEAVQETEQRLGADRSTWAWGKLATVLFEHSLAPLADKTLRLKMTVGPAPKAGDATVVGVAAYRSDDFHAQLGASFRMVLDVGRWDNSLAVNTPGQSGDPSSPHYRDPFPLWLKGQYFPLLYSRAAVEKATERTILLQPR